MLKVAIFVGGELDGFTTDFDYFVGVDRASLRLLDQGLPLDLAIGDFDSVSPEELEVIQSWSKRCIIAPAEKDDTDTELALKTVFKDFPDASVTIFGAFGGRMDHTLSNIFLPSDPILAKYMSQIRLEDSQNRMIYRPSGCHQIAPENSMTYVSFLHEGQGQLEIIGAKYELVGKHYFQKKIYSSNEFVGQPITLSIPDGYVVIIYSKDRR